MCDNNLILLQLAIDNNLIFWNLQNEIAWEINVRNRKRKNSQISFRVA